MRAFSCDSRLAGGGQLLKHWGWLSASGGMQLIVLTCASHVTAGFEIIVSLMSYTAAPAAGGQVAVRWGAFALAARRRIARRRRVEWVEELVESDRSQLNAPQVVAALSVGNTGVATG